MNGARRFNFNVCNGPSFPFLVRKRELGPSIQLQRVQRTKIQRSGGANRSVRTSVVDQDQNEIENTAWQ